MLLCHITSNVKSDKYQTLLQEKGGNGFPYLVFMDSEGNVLAKHEGARNAEGFEKSAGKAAEFTALKKKAEEGDAAAKIDLLIAQLTLNHLKVEEAQKRLKELGDVPKDKQEKIAGMILNAEVNEIARTITKEKPTRLAAGKKYLEMKKAGRVPTADQEMQVFWILMMEFAENEKDAETYEAGLATLKAKFGGNPRTKKFFEEKEAALEKLKGDKKPPEKKDDKREF